MEGIRKLIRGQQWKQSSARRAEEVRERLDKLQKWLEETAREWEKIASSPETQRRFEELYGTASDHAGVWLSTLSSTLRKTSNGLKGALGGGGLGVLTGLLLGGGGVGIVGLGGAVGLPLIAITGIVGAFLGRSIGRELDFLIGQWNAPIARRFSVFKQIEANTVTFRRIGRDEHARVMADAIASAQRFVCIRSAFISANVVDIEFGKTVKAALSRGVDVFIEYGQDWNSFPTWNARARSDAIKRLQEIKAEGESHPLRGTLYVGATKTHAKELSVDGSFAAIGSFNWLSNKSGQRHEASIIIEHSRISGEIFDDTKKSLGHIKCYP